MSHTAPGPTAHGAPQDPPDALTASEPALGFPPATPEPLSPAPDYARLRDECPVAAVRLPSGDRAWLVTRYLDNRALLADPRLSRRAAAEPGAPRLRAAPLERRSLTTLDPPEHTRLRDLVLRAFTSGRVERLRPRLAATADALLAAMVEAGTSGDLVAGFARPLAISVIGDLLGVPADDRPRFREWTEDYLGASRTGIEDADARLKGYFGDLLARRRLAPGDDLFSSLAVRAPDAAADDADLVVLGLTLLVAGYETAANQIAAGTVVLLSEPARYRALRDRPELLETAVEELLRYTPVSVSGGTIRVATEDTEIGGTAVRAGEGVLPALVSANRDASVFDRPDELDLERSPNPHVAFGHGVHRCLGAQLARAELRAAFAALTRRMPDLRLTVPVEEIDWRREGMIRGPRVLPVAW
ncbi:cytochrome P450 [Actinomadura rupiterrae]|uniref:cytochrome P450 n=1 Tax=Actinomadura rupiterrae TaxID=559627 RepID=UPI0020A3DA97|nr:cytochrome P450 [Actinomadura rupiterrae]MCP2341066.1 nocardicin N-oxygenase [Actinomadura rupiterrae]